MKPPKDPIAGRNSGRSLVAEGLDRVHLRGPLGGVEAEEDADAHRDAERGQHGAERDDRVLLGGDQT